MQPSNQASRSKFRRFIPFILVFLILLSMACDPLYDTSKQGPVNVPTNIPNPYNQQVETYFGTGKADTTFEYSNVPSVQTNDCHDTLTEAILKIYVGDRTLPANAGFTQPLGPGEVYFASEIHAALKNPWQNKQCVYAEDKNEYQLTQINGILNIPQAELTPLYTSETICPNAAKFVKSAFEIELTYNCKKGPTTYHYHIILQRQLPAATAKP